MSSSGAAIIQTVTLCKRAVVFSTGLNSGTPVGESEIFVLSSDELIDIAPRIGQFRVTIIVENSTVNVQTQAVFQKTEDGVTWTDPTTQLETTQEEGDRKTTTSWYTTVAEFTRGIRIGVKASRKNAGDDVEMCLVTMIADFEMRS